MSPTQTSRSYRVGFIPHAAYSLAFGGMEVQQEATIHALQDLGVDAVRFDVWSNTLDVDVVHVFGSEFSHTEVIERLTAKGVPTVITAMFMPERPLMVFRAWRMIDRFLPSTTYSLRRRSLNNATAVVALSEFEKRSIEYAYGIESHKIHVIANGVEERFFNATPEVFEHQHGMKDFVLCVGSIDPRKNQLLLAEAMVDCNQPTVFIGSPSTHGGARTTEYVQQFASFVAKHSSLRWISGIDHTDPMLPSAFAAARVHVLVSTAEAQGLVSLEAAAAGCPIVVSDMVNLREIFGDGANYAKPSSKQSIIRAVEHAMNSQQIPPVLSEKREWLQSWHDVAVKLNTLYQSVFRG